MTDYEFIMVQCKKYHFTQWNDKNRMTKNF